MLRQLISFLLGSPDSCTVYLSLYDVVFPQGFFTKSLRFVAFRSALVLNSAVCTRIRVSRRFLRREWSDYAVRAPSSSYKASSFAKHDTGPPQNPTRNTRSRAFNEARDLTPRGRRRASRCVSRCTGRPGCHHCTRINHFTYTTRWRMKQCGKIHGVKWAMLLCLSLSLDSPVLRARAARRSPFVEVASIRCRTIVRGVALSQTSSSELAYVNARVIVRYADSWRAGLARVKCLEA